MARGTPLTDDAARRQRVAAQLLDRPVARSVIEVVGRLAGVQAQLPSAAALGLSARVDGLTPEAVERARTVDRSIVLVWAMRGTLHLVRADDYGWLVPLVTAPRTPNAHRRLQQEGVGRDAAADAVRHIRRMVERDGPLGRADIARRLRSRGIPAEGQAVAHLLWLAAAEGVICHGPGTGRAQRFALVDDWIGTPRPADHAGALRELAVRFLRSHAPAEPDDLAAWAGIGVGDARRAWGAVGRQLVEIQTTRGPCWRLRSTIREAASDAVRLLPAFDEYLLGWRDRAFIAPADRWREINRGGGWLRPVVLADGRAVAIWSSQRARGRLSIEVRPFGRLSASVRGGVDAEAARVGRFLDTPSVTVSVL